ncbi:hypothetical protein EAL2_c20340 [Peptoclostridium acidaminophilum DSM 3953]|uniref:Uncharacterized protein n=1 Tax=Peptoclostridium acidaminophilum DSM 3953 TaxID=1286171 RepID=W8T8V2_PEPAC|nr:sigma-70 family RNA polymerase sigma factor [Peptoclostridium acidaminophilum]AHM57315.1 hypothetical protein EAL2_c20340 [Peptoclostridium acidaminophilum DSM 3953]
MNFCNQEGKSAVVEQEHLEAQRLAELACEGCKDSTHELVERFTPLLRGKCRQYFGVVDEDLLQDGIVKLLELIRDFEPQRGANFCGYAKYMISTFYWNLKRKRILEESRRAEADVSDEHSERSGACDYEIAGVETRMALETLPEAQRDVIELIYMQGLSTDETAKRLGISYSYASKLSRRALRQLRDGPLSRDEWRGS